MTENENISKNNITINLKQCESKLKDSYNISYNESLIVLQMNILKDNMKIPRIEYEIYYPFNNNLTKLNLEICENMNAYIYIPIELNNNIDRYNISSKYYNDICYKVTSDKGTDITLNDRKNIFINNFMNICEENCQFEKYDLNNEIARCSCNIKSSLQLYSQVNKNITLLLAGYKNKKNIINLSILKCYNILSNINEISKNVGFYIVLSILIFYLISIIKFYKIDYKIIKNKIYDIVYNIKNKKNYKIKIKKTRKIKNSKKNKIKLAPIKKTKKKKKKKKIFSINRIQINNMIQNNNVNENSKRILIYNKKENENFKFEYNSNELNYLTYKDAIIYDNRTYIQYYFSLITTKHLLFYCCALDDYNSSIIKIFLFFISFIINLIINALFFNDSVIHKIYIDNGEYNLLYQIPQIIYSSLISTILIIILKRLALTEQNILKLKNIKNKRTIKTKSQKLSESLYYKFISFFIISFIFLLFFWYYITLFCAIFENTQIHLIKNVLISFGLNMLYPFVIYLIPGIFRIPSLKSNQRETMYNFSMIIQII